MESRCLVTLDLDFANVLEFPPQRYSGIAVLRLAEPVSMPSFAQAAHTLAQALAAREIAGQLWIVQENRVRQYGGENEDSVQ